MRYKVYTQSRTVRTYYVEAESEGQARDLVDVVIGGVADEDAVVFDDVTEPDGEEIVDVKEWR